MSDPIFAAPTYDYLVILSRIDGAWNRIPITPLEDVARWAYPGDPDDVEPRSPTHVAFRVVSPLPPSMVKADAEHRVAMFSAAHPYSGYPIRVTLIPGDAAGFVHRIDCIWPFIPSDSYAVEVADAVTRRFDHPRYGGHTINATAADYGGLRIEVVTDKAMDPPDLLDLIAEEFETDHGMGARLIDEDCAPQTYSYRLVHESGLVKEMSDWF